jgi:hypothetical protein
MTLTADLIGAIRRPGRVQDSAYTRKYLPDATAPAAAPAKNALMGWLGELAALLKKLEGMPEFQRMKAAGAAPQAAAPSEEVVSPRGDLAESRNLPHPGGATDSAERSLVGLIGSRSMIEHRAPVGLDALLTPSKKGR